MELSSQRRKMAVEVVTRPSVITVGSVLDHSVSARPTIVTYLICSPRTNGFEICRSVWRKCNDPVNFCSGVIMRRDTREYGHGRRRKEMDGAA